MTTFTDLAIVLAHPARETIINLLEDGTITMGDLAQQLGLCPASTCHHVDTLEPIGLVRRCRRGRSVFVEATCIPEIVLYPIPVARPAVDRAALASTAIR
jgi:DNA-binding MarR family transcriptional regulator